MLRSIGYIAIAFLMGPSSVMADSPIVGGLGISFDDPLQAILERGYNPAWSERRPDSAGKYVKLDAKEYFSMMYVYAAPSSGTVYGVEGVHFQDDTGIRNCMLELGRIDATLKEKYPRLVEPRTTGNSPNEIFYKSRCEAKRPGFLNAIELCEGRSISLMCGKVPDSSSESPLEQNKSSLSIRYSKSSEESKAYYDETTILRNSLREKKMENSGFDKNQL